MNAIITRDCTHDPTFRHSSPSVFIRDDLMLKLETLYSRIPLSRTLKGNENLFEITGVRHSEGGVKLHPEHIYSEKFIMYY